MKNLLYTAGIIAGLLTGADAFSQSYENSTQKDFLSQIPKATEQDMKITSEGLITNPSQYEIESLSPVMRKNVFMLVAKEYEIKAMQYKTLLEDSKQYTEKIKSLDESVKTLEADKKNLQTDLKECEKQGKTEKSK